MQNLIPCPSCRRHVSTDEAACPFCAVDLTDTMGSLRARPRPRIRLGRSALFVYGATAVLASVAAVACQSDDGLVGSGPAADPGALPSKPHDASTAPANKPQDASALPSKPRDASTDARSALGRDAAPNEASDAALAPDARVTAQRDAGDAGDAALPLDAGAEPPFDWDAEVFIPIYALVAPPPRPREQPDTVPAFARPEPAAEEHDHDQHGSGGERVST